MKIGIVTACPAGVAHTYMTANALQMEAEKLGHICKVEKQGSLGIEDELDQTYINECDVIVFAVAVMVEFEERFEDKKIYEVDISAALKNPAGVIESALKLV